ncbi:CIC11C00000004363 [Sungouiella intermedia]|uniref:tRNA pseudouridine synthase 1 n=1 Tax=Sungouiella intermedia TaxID=45354 RepID=A0A1L0G1V9_9ASCO|nr:CIC11C00000004363 [[Candida] intermedia]
MIGYCGSGYNGMQIQNNPDVKTIEAEIFKAFIESGAVSKENSTDLKKNGFMRAARTDKGVHAAGNVVSCKLILEDEDIMAKINSHLPDQIRVWGIERVNRSFDCRKLCSSRIYEYLLPTHSLLPPRPKSSLYNLIEASRIEHPGILRDDPDVEWWSTTRERIVETGVTQEELEQVFEKTAEVTEDTKKEYYGEDGEVTEWGKLVKKIRGVENECRRDYRVSKEKLELFRSAMKQYEGSHNFHNFTLGKTYKDPSARRFMKGTSVSEPFTIEGTEWISIKIHGQSFMLHQIRKMICMASLVVRTGCPITRISDCFGPAKINIPKAPALGLLLECPVYETYNEKLEDMGYNKLDFSRYNTEMDAFKMKYIYDKIYGEEIKENVYHGFFEFLDTFKGSGATKEGKHIFDFLGAAFNNGLENKETVKGDVPAKAADNID